MDTYTLGESVWENSALLFFYKRILGCSFLPTGSTPRWEGGVVSALYVLQTRVLFVCIFFLGTLREVFNVSVCTHLCICFCIIYACIHVCPTSLNF